MSSMLHGSKIYEIRKEYSRECFVCYHIAVLGRKFDKKRTWLFLICFIWSNGFVYPYLCRVSPLKHKTAKLDMSDYLSNSN